MEGEIYFSCWEGNSSKICHLGNTNLYYECLLASKDSLSTDEFDDGEILVGF
jgi:hypothetical protein